MAYYNREGKILELGPMAYLSEGKCASVFYNGKIILKQYFNKTEGDLRLTPKMFDILKDINNEHFIKIFDIYSEMSKFEFFKYNLKLKKFIVDAYTAPYYSDDSVNVLFESIDYLLDNFRELQQLIDIFTDNSIMVNDLKRKNTILSSKGIIIIDPDLFIKSRLAKDSISFTNKEALLLLFKSICIACINKYDGRRIILRENLTRLIDFDLTLNTDIIYELEQRLKRYRKPIDYLAKK